MVKAAAMYHRPSRWSMILGRKFHKEYILIVQFFFFLFCFVFFLVLKSVFLRKSPKVFCFGFLLCFVFGVFFLCFFVFVFVFVLFLFLFLFIFFLTNIFEQG